MTESCLTKSQSIQERKVDLFSSIKFLIEKSAPISGAFVMQSTAERKEELTGSEYGTGVQLSWLEHLPCKQGVNGSNPFISTIKWAHSSAGQSTRLISVRSMVRVHLSPPNPFQWGGSLRANASLLRGEKKKINNCIANSMFIMEIIDEYERQREIFILAK